MNSLNNAFLPSALFKTTKSQIPHIIAVGGGKGGVGKSSIAMMMALYLAEKGAGHGVGGCGFNRR